MLKHQLIFKSSVFPDERRCYTVKQCWNQLCAPSGTQECILNLINFIWCFWFWLWFFWCSFFFAGGGWGGKGLGGIVCWGSPFPNIAVHSSPGKAVFQNSHEDFSVTWRFSTCSFSKVGSKSFNSANILLFSIKKPKQQQKKPPNRKQVKITCYSKLMYSMALGKLKYQNHTLMSPFLTIL